MSTTIGDRTILGPLTTVFTPPAPCATLMVESDPGGTMSVTWGASCTQTGDFGGTSIVDDAACYPSGFRDYVNIWSSSTMAMYSPASACPAGYYEAYTVTHGVGETTPKYPSPTTYFYAYSSIWAHMNEGEEVVGCCVSGYSLHTDEYQLCISTTKAPSAFVSGYYFTENCSVVTTRVTLDESASIAEATNLGILMLRQASDPPRPKASGTGTDVDSDSPIATGANGPDGDSSTSNTSNTSTSSTGLPMRTIIIIVVVAVGLLLAILALILYLLRRRKQKRAAAAAALPPFHANPQNPSAPGSTQEKPLLSAPHGAPALVAPPPGHPGPPELMGTPGGAQHHKNELDGTTTFIPRPSPVSTPVHELGQNARPWPGSAATTPYRYEMPAPAARQAYEMPGGGYGPGQGHGHGHGQTPPQELDNRAPSVSPISAGVGQQQRAYFPPPPPPPSQFAANVNQPWRHT